MFWEMATYIRYNLLSTSMYFRLMVRSKQGSAICKEAPIEEQLFSRDARMNIAIPISSYYGIETILKSTQSFREVCSPTRILCCQS
jgi:hypothetical protein